MVRVFNLTHRKLEGSFLILKNAHDYSSCSSQPVHWWSREDRILKRADVSLGGSCTSVTCMIFLGVWWLCKLFSWIVLLGNFLIQIKDIWRSLILKFWFSLVSSTLRVFHCNNAVSFLGETASIRENITVLLAAEFFSCSNACIFCSCCEASDVLY